MDCRLCVVTGDLDQTLLSSPLDMLAQTFNQRRDWDSGISLICANHRSSDVACSGSVRRFSSTPRRISARTITLVPISATGV